MTRLQRPQTDREVAAAVAIASATGLGVVIWMGVSSESAGALRAVGGPATFAGQMTGLVGAYLMLLMLLLVARLPLVERYLGQDRLLRWHRLLGQWPVYLICLHAVLVTVGYAQSARTGVMHELAVLLRSYPDVLAALVALVLVVGASVVSIRQIRRAIRYETWWSIHLYLYLALALAFAHQLANGQSFFNHPGFRLFWAMLWSTTAGLVIAFRLVVPLARSLRHDLRVVRITPENADVVSVVCRGRHLARLRVDGGQFFQWRFLAPGHWWSAHPYSISAMPRSDLLRFTVKELGDHSAGLAEMPVGTRVLIEGPYGTFTRRSTQRDKVLLIGAGVGATPIRALLEDLPRSVDVCLLLRATSENDVVFGGEFESLIRRRRHARMLVLAGSRFEHPLDRQQLAHLVPDIAQRDVYVCGPESLAQSVTAAARSLGVPERNIHCEQFAF